MCRSRYVSGDFACHIRMKTLPLLFRSRILCRHPIALRRTQPVHTLASMSSPAIMHTKQTSLRRSSIHADSFFRRAKSPCSRMVLVLFRLRRVSNCSACSHSLQRASLFKPHACEEIYSTPQNDHSHSLTTRQSTPSGRNGETSIVWTESHSGRQGSIHPRYKSGSLKHRTPCQRTSRSSAPSPCCGHRRRLLHKARMVLAFLSSELSITLYQTLPCSPAHDVGELAFLASSQRALLTPPSCQRARLSCELSTRSPYATFLPASSPFLRALNAHFLRHLPAAALEPRDQRRGGADVLAVELRALGRPSREHLVLGHHRHR